MQLEIIKKEPTEYAYIPKKKTTAVDLEMDDELPNYMENEELGVFLGASKKYGLELDFEIFRTLAYTGIRIGELCALKEKDVFNKDGYVINISKTYYNPTNNIKKYTLVPPKTKRL